MLTCMINSFTLSAFALIMDKSKLLWKLSNAKHRLANKMAEQYKKHIYPLFSHKGVNLLQLAYNNNQFDVFGNLINTTENTITRYSYIEGLLRKALLVDQDFGKAKELIKSVKLYCNNAKQIVQLIHPCNVISVYDDNIDSLYLNFTSIPSAIDKPMGNYRTFVSNETYDTIVEFLCKEFIENKLINIEQLYEIFKFACCYDKNNIAEIIYNIAESNGMSFTDKYKMDNVFIELCSSPYIKLFTVQWFYGTYLRNNFNFDLNNMFAQSIRNTLCKNGNCEIANWLLKMADEMSISIDLKGGDEYLIVKDIIYENPKILDWYIEICKSKDIIIPLSLIAFDVIDKCLSNEIYDESLCSFLIELKKSTTYDELVSVLNYDGYMIERKLYERFIKLMESIDSDKLNISNKNMVSMSKSKKQKINKRKQNYEMNEYNENKYINEYKSLTNIYEVLYSKLLSTNLQSYLMDRNMYLRTLHVKLSNPESDVIELGFEVCSICQRGTSLLLVKDSKNNTQMLRCSECNKHFMNRNMEILQIIVRNKSYFNSDFEKYKEWYDKLSDIGYMLLVGKFDFIKHEQLNSNSELLKLSNVGVYNYINLGI